MGFDWYEEDLLDFILKYDLPASSTIYDIKKFYKNHSKQFLSDFSLMIKQDHYRGHSLNFYQRLNKIKASIKETFQNIYFILENYDNLDFMNAQIMFDKLMEKILPRLFVTSINGLETYNQSLYRIRPIKEGEKLNKPCDLFHIPYSKRNLITNERYSLAGHPCLYLSTYLGISWEECGFPSQFYYSQFEYEPKPDDWKFITLVSPKKFSRILNSIIFENEDFQLDYVERYLLSYPLTFACSIVNISGDSVFKQEYILPQMLLQWIQRNYDRIKGITYFSCITKDESLNINGYNIVIPANDFNKKGYGKNLCKKFKVSKPIYCDNLLNNKNREIIKTYKNDLWANFNNLPMSAMECMTRIYEACCCFETLTSNIGIKSMRPIVLSIQSVKYNCDFIKTLYDKTNIIEEAENSLFDSNRDDRIKTFCTFYERFLDTIYPIITQYNLDLLKINVPDIPEFFSLC